MSIRRAATRYHGTEAGIESWHCFAAGPHYDPENVSLGPLLAVDDHLVEPGAGFDWHAHRGVDIVSHVLAGVLRHEDSDGRVLEVEAGGVLVQVAGSGTRHRETNPSKHERLRLVQTTVLGATGTPSLEVGAARPIALGAATVDTSAEGTAPLWHLYVAAGARRYGDHQLAAGDSVRGRGWFATSGDGVLLAVRMNDDAPG